MTIGPGCPGPLSHDGLAPGVARGRLATHTTADEGLPAFMKVRPRLFALAYRMLGSAAAAEDIVQDVWVRWQTTDRGVVRDPAAFLATTATRLAINVKQSARSRRETCVESWPQEPVDSSADPAGAAERDQALSAALQMLLEKLSAAERTAYVLREAFNYPYRDIARVLRIAEANARQLATRARHHVSGGRRASVSPVQHRQLLGAFVAAARSGELRRLEALFASGVVPAPHGGRLVRAA